MDNQKKYAGNHGRKPKPDKMRHRYVFRLDEGYRPFPRAFRRVGQGDQGGVYRFRTFRQGD